MNEFCLIYVIEEGVLGIGKNRVYGVDAVYFIDGIQFERVLETDEYEVYLEDIDPRIQDYLDM